MVAYCKLIGSVRLRAEDGVDHWLRVSIIGCRWWVLGSRVVVITAGGRCLRGAVPDSHPTDTNLTGCCTLWWMVIRWRRRCSGWVGSAGGGGGGGG